MEFNSIGYFQFNNLLQSRIPLVLVLLDPVDLKPWYNSLVHMHLDNVTVICEPQETLTIIQEKNLPDHFAIVILDMNGTKSPSVTVELEKAGYTNAYYVKDGFAGISAERQT
jgi:rhodanese-related sulfurtransferase